MKENNERGFKKKEGKGNENDFSNINQSKRHNNPNDKYVLLDDENIMTTGEHKRRKIIVEGTNELDRIPFVDKFQQFNNSNENKITSKEYINIKDTNPLKQTSTKKEQEHFNYKNKETSLQTLKAQNSSSNIINIHRMKNLEYDEVYDELYNEVKQHSNELTGSNNISPLVPSKSHGQSFFNKNKYNIHDTSVKKGNGCHQKTTYGFSTSDYYLYNIKPVKNTTYEDAKILNQLWNTYIDELTETLSSDIFLPSVICELELNGAYLEIHKSYCATYVGIKGIVLLETVNAFKMITPQSKIVTILKNKTVFSLSIKTKTYFLNGVHLIRDPALKAAKKFKHFKNK